MENDLVIIDTDGGTDDLLAIMMVLVQTTWSILAITCGFGNVPSDQSCGNILRLLNFLNRTEIPVYQGTRSSLLGTAPNATNYHGLDGMGGSSQHYPLPQNIELHKGHASEILVKLAAKHPGNITLIALGPLTNVAVAHHLDPLFNKKLKQLFIMGGNVQGEGNIVRAAEFNFYCDPEAAYIVMNEFPSTKVIIPVEACEKYHVSWEFYEKWSTANTSKSEFIRKIHKTTVSFLVKESHTEFQSCDLVAMTTIVHPDSVTQTQYKSAIVELQGSITRGMLVVDQRPGSKSDPNAHFYNGIDQIKLEQYWNNMIL